MGSDKSSEPPSIREVFRRARTRAGLKQEEVAAAVPGLTQSTYSRFELGQADLDVSEIFKIKEFLDKQEYKKAGAVMSLRDLMARPVQPGALADSAVSGLPLTFPGGPPMWSGKLTEVVAKELEDEYALKEAVEMDRQLDVELPALRKKLEQYERIFNRDTELIRSLKVEANKVPALESENAELKTQIAELMKKQFSTGATPKKSKRTKGR